MRVTLTLLGTGTPNPSLNRAGSSYLVTSGEQRIMVDCGPRAMHRLLETGIGPAEIDALLLTHLHYDHCVDYAHLLLSRWSEGRDGITPLRVIGPPGTSRLTELLVGTDGAFAPDIATRPPRSSLPDDTPTAASALANVTEVNDGDQLETAAWRVTVAEVQHYQPHLVPLAYRLDLGDRAIVFGGDTAPVPRLTELASGATALLHMCHYLNIDEPADPELLEFCSGHLDAARTAEMAGVETLILVHLPPQLDNQAVQSRIVEYVAETFSGRTFVGHDLLAITL